MCDRQCLSSVLESDTLHGLRCHTLVFAAKVGSALAYSAAMALLDCFTDTRGPWRGQLIHDSGGRKPTWTSGSNSLDNF